MRQARQLQRPDRGAGFTMIELLIVMVILAVLLAIAVPSMREFIARKRVEGVAQELATDLRLLKSQQIQRRRNVGIQFGSNASITCYVLYQVGTAGDDCDCTNVGGACPNPAADNRSFEIKTVVMPISSGISLTANPGFMRLIGFNALPMGNTMIRATVQSTQGGGIRVSTNRLGTPLVCSVSGSWNNLPAC